MGWTGGVRLCHNVPGITILDLEREIHRVCLATRCGGGGREALG